MVESIPKISIIVPVYNTEQYLHKCVKSILNQTFIDFELLLINDGSTDKSGEICNQYALKDPRVKVFHKENEGVSSARQLGIDLAKGKYSIHVDSDDWVEKDILNQMYDFVTFNNSDMLMVDFYIESDGREIYRSQKPSAFDCHSIINDLLKNKLLGSLCNKLIRHELFSLYNISLSKEINYCEDLLVVIQLLNKDINVTHLGKAYFHYVDNTNSITRAKSKAKIYEQIKAVNKLEYILKMNNKYDFTQSIAVFKVQFKMDFIRCGLLNQKEYKKILPINLTKKNTSKLRYFFLYIADMGFYKVSHYILLFFTGLEKYKLKKVR